MSLTGALEAFPLPEVLQLLSRSEKSGALRVRGNALEAKVFLADGACTYASTRTDDNFHADLVQAALVEDADWRKIERHEAVLGDYLVEGKSPEDLSDFVAERIHEVLYQLLRLERGTFEFVPEVEPRTPTGVKQPVDLCLEQARSRLAEWQDIESVIPDMRLRLVMEPHLDREEIVVDREAWEILASMGGAASVADAAQRLGWTEYQTAKAMARLVRDGLIRLLDGEREGGLQEAGEEAPVRDFSLVDSEDPTDQGEAEAASPEEEEEEVADDEDGDEASLLRVALSEVVNPVAGDEDADDETPVLRRRGLGAIARERRNE